jgi:hypothetical protein
MSAFPEYRFKCDRCEAELYLPMENTPAGNKGPHGWLQLRVGVDPSTPARHLCIDCVAAFKEFFSTQEATGAGIETQGAGEANLG